MKYTVILLWPDYATDNYGQDTYMTSVEARSPNEALWLARGQAMDSRLSICEPEDLFVIAVIEGDHQDVKP